MNVQEDQLFRGARFCRTPAPCSTSGPWKQLAENRYGPAVSLRMLFRTFSFPVSLAVFDDEQSTASPKPVYQDQPSTGRLLEAVLHAKFDCGADAKYRLFFERRSQVRSASFTLGAPLLGLFIRSNGTTMMQRAQPPRVADQPRIFVEFR